MSIKQCLQKAVIGVGIAAWMASGQIHAEEPHIQPHLPSYGAHQSWVLPAAATSVSVPEEVPKGSISPSDTSHFQTVESPYQLMSREHPWIKIYTPRDQQKVTQNTLTIKGQVLNSRVNQLLINGSQVELQAKGEFVYSLLLSQQSPQNHIIFEGKIGQNNTKTHAISVHYSGVKTSLSKFGFARELYIDQKEAYMILKRHIGLEERGDYRFEKIDMNTLIPLLADEFDLNIVYDANPSQANQEITISYENIHPIDLLESVLTYWKCSWYLKDDMIKIENQEPLRVISLDYLSVEDVLNSIKNISSLSEMTIEPTERSIIAKGSIGKLNQLEQLIRQVDVRPKQVRIEAVIIESNYDVSEGLGIDFQKMFAQTSKVLKESGDYFMGLADIKVPAVDFMAAFKNRSDVDVLANPKILVTNHQKANINTGTTQGYTTQSTTSTGSNTSVIENIKFLNTGVTLEITPHINDRDEILMEIKPEISEGLVENNTPRSSTTQADTQVLLKDGQTIVIGGLIQNKKGVIVKKVPFLSALPVVGGWFTFESITEKKLEITVLITPYIVRINEPEMAGTY